VQRLEHLNHNLAQRFLLGTALKTPVLDWRERLVCSRCGSRQADMVVSGTAPR
jgi:hypothetical protein